MRRDTGEDYETFLRGLAAASGIATPTRAELARLDRKRPKKGSNDDWTHPQDPDAKITKMKHGRSGMVQLGGPEPVLELSLSLQLGPDDRRQRTEKPPPVAQWSLCIV